MATTGVNAVAALFDQRQFTVVAGPCVAESQTLCVDLAKTLKAICDARNLPLIFKASFDKANRTSHQSFRGHGMQAGLEALSAVQQETGLQVITDVHVPEHVERVAQVADVLQIPAFLCRQTDLLAAAAQTHKPINIKKGQFLAPHDMRHVVRKYRHLGGGPLSVTERGSCFGYNDLVVDMRGLVTMADTLDAPIIFDATHSVQRPGQLDGASGGDRRLAPPLARAACAVGIDGLFCEVHYEPDKALSDGANALTPGMLSSLLDDVVAIRSALRRV